MKIVFYSTNSNCFNKDTFIIKVKPDNQTRFENFCQKYPEHSFYCVSQGPALFMPENSVILVQEDAGIEEFAKKVLSFQPDIAIAMTFWVSPYDWLTVNDALVAEKLEKEGVKTFCHSVEAGLTCFDKWKTHQFMELQGVNVPSALFIDHDLYFCAGSHKEVIDNVYKNSIRSQLEKLNLPIIIKDSAGLSSYGMTVVHSYGEAEGYLNSKRNNSNRIVEEYIRGQQFGLEIYGVPGNYTVFPLFNFSLNQYGITSPKQSAKYGPFPLDDELKNSVLLLAEKLELRGCAQFDLIKSQEKWYVIEINPRLSGMTFTSSVLCGKTVFEILYLTCIENQNIQICGTQRILNLKLPLLEESEMNEILNIPGVMLLNQTNDLAAKQEREKGFCECIIKRNTLEEIQETLFILKNRFPFEATILQSETILK